MDGGWFSGMVCFEKLYGSNSKSAKKFIRAPSSGMTRRCVLRTSGPTSAATASP